MTKIILTKNIGYQWTENGGIWIKGYFFYSDENKKIEGQDAIDVLKSIKTYDDFYAFLQSIDGIYSIIISLADQLWAAVDIARSHPLYFSCDGTMISDDSEQLRKLLNIDPSHTDDIALLSLFTSESVMFNGTVYKEIKQLNLGQSIKILPGSYHLNYYYRHISTIQQLSREEAFNKLSTISNETFDRLIRAINGRPIILSLSGGYDSRYIAFMLKERGVTNVLCYSYGKDDSFELKISEEVAKKLGFTWHRVTYTHDTLKDFFINPDMDYIDFATQHDYILYLQNYFAVKELKKTGLVAPNAVFITGLCGDLPTGQYIMDMEMYEKIDLSIDSMADIFIESIFHSGNLSDNVKKIYKSEILTELNEAASTLNGIQDYIQLDDNLQTMARHSRCFLNANINHEFCGNEYLLPLWDKNWLDFWYSLPLEYRLRQNLYEEFVVDKLGGKYNITHKKSRGSYLPWAFTKKRAGTRLKYFVGGVLARVCYPLGIPMRLKSDVNNVMSVSLLLFQKIGAKDMIYYPKAGFAFLFKLYLLEQRYGDTALRRLKKYL